MYSNTAAAFRADLTNALLEQGSGWESNLIGDRVLPVINVDTKSGLYPVFKLANGGLLRNEAKQHAPGAKFPRVARKYDQDTYATIGYGIEEPLAAEDVKDMSRFFDMELMAAKLSNRYLLLRQEIAAAALLFNATTFPSTNSGTAYTIANIATFDLGLDVDSAKDRILQKGEDINNLSVIMSNAVFLRARASTKLQNRLRGIGISSDAILNVGEAAVAEALGVKEVIVGKAYYDGSAEADAATFSATAIWSNTFVWVGNIGSSGGYQNLFGGGAAFTLNWAQYGPVRAVESYRDETIDSDVVRAKQHVAEKVVNANAATMIATQYS